MKLPILFAATLLAQGSPATPNAWPCKIKTERAVACSGDDPGTAIEMYQRFSARPAALLDEGTMQAIAQYGCFVFDRGASGPGRFFEHGRAQVATLNGYRPFVIVDTRSRFYVTLDQRWLAGTCPKSPSPINAPSHG